MTFYSNLSLRGEYYKVEEGSTGVFTDTFLRCNANMCIEKI